MILILSLSVANKLVGVTLQPGQSCEEPLTYECGSIAHLWCERTHETRSVNVSFTGCPCPVSPGVYGQEIAIFSYPLDADDVRVENLLRLPAIFDKKTLVRWFEREPPATDRKRTATGNAHSQHKNALSAR